VPFCKGLNSFYTKEGATLNATNIPNFIHPDASIGHFQFVGSRNRKNSAATNWKGALQLL